MRLISQVISRRDPTSPASYAAAWASQSAVLNRVRTASETSDRAIVPSKSARMASGGWPGRRGGMGTLPATAERGGSDSGGITIGPG